MKVIDLVKMENLHCRAREGHILYKYLNDDCVVAYVKNSFGVMFIIQTKQKYMSFFNMTLKGVFYGYLTERISENKAMEILNTAKERKTDEVFIENDDTIKKIEAIAMMGELAK